MDRSRVTGGADSTEERRLLDEQVKVLSERVRGLEGDKLTLLQQLSRVERGAAGSGEGLRWHEPLVNHPINCSMNFSPNVRQVDYRVQFEYQTTRTLMYIHAHLNIPQAQVTVLGFFKAAVM